MSKSTIGRFITLEGGEGVGKSTLLRGLAQWLEALGVPVITTREPGGTPLGEQLRSLAFSRLHPPTSHTELFLMMASRMQHIQEKIIPSLERGEWVICDRYIDSSRVYQGLCGKVGLHFIDAMWNEIRRVFPRAEPDCTIVLDCSVELSLPRVKNRQGESTRFDEAQEQFHRDIREGFLQIATEYQERCSVLDAAQPPADLLESVKSIINTRLRGL